MHSDDAAQREGAAFELWLTHVFCSQGFAPVREAVIPGSSKRSDYLLERLGTSVFVEARASLTAERFPTDVGERVKTVVREKLKKFASPPNCAVIAVDSPPPSSSTGIKQGLLGDRNYVGRDYVANMPPNFVVRTHKRDGLFTTELSGGLIGTTLSAILLHTVRHGESGVSMRQSSYTIRTPLTRFPLRSSPG